MMLNVDYKNISAIDHSKNYDLFVFLTQMKHINCIRKKGHMSVMLAF